MFYDWRVKESRVAKGSCSQGQSREIKGSQGESEL